ncbi:MAG TPA: AAA family ATPase [Gaiellaceae bacterium]|nr:AAA family ATPase [Gaiellaceae bacterium]
MLKLSLSGSWDDLRALRAAIETGEGIELVESLDAADVVVHASSGSAHRDELAQVREHSHAPVVLLAPPGAAGLLEVALDSELADVLILPQPSEAVIFSARKLATTVARRRAERSRARIATVFSPKGGTGKSVVACNLAVALAQNGRRTLLVDLDLQFGDAAIMLGLQPMRTAFELLSSPGSLDAEKIAGYATSFGPNLDVLAAPLKPEDAESISDARVGELLDAARSGYDCVVVDTSPFFQGPVLAALDRTDDLLLVCTPDVPAMKNVRLTLQTLELLSFPVDRLRLVLNRANARVGFRAAQVSTVLEHELEFELPEDENVLVSVNRGVPAVQQRASSAFSQGIARIAAALGGGSVPERRRESRRFSLGRQR